MSSRGRRRRRNCRGMGRWKTVKPQDYRTERQAAKFLGVGKNWLRFLPIPLYRIEQRRSPSDRSVFRNYRFCYYGADLISVRPFVWELIAEERERREMYYQRWEAMCSAVSTPNTRIDLLLNGRRYSQYNPGLLNQVTVSAGGIEWKPVSNRWVAGLRQLVYTYEPVEEVKESDVSRVVAWLVDEGFFEAGQ